MQDLLIIGAGVAGLSAGVYGQLNGFRTQIYEMHDKPGGLCTSWKRQGYTFDGCIHWLVGSSPASSLYPIWRQLGALQDRRFVDPVEFIRIEDESGKAFVLYTDIGQLERHMLELAPGDRQVIRQFTDAVRTFARSDISQDMPQGFLAKLGLGLKMLPFMRTFSRYSQVSVSAFAQRFRDPFLRKSFALSFGGSDMSMVAMMMTLAWMHNHAAGYPIGGSLDLARAIERRYLGLGGQIHYRSRVARILEENGRAVGLLLADGHEARGDVVISAADGHATLHDMLQGRFLTDEWRQRFETLPVFAPIVQVSIGVNRDLSAEPRQVSWPLAEPVELGGRMQTRIGYHHYCEDPTMAPQGKSTVTVYWDADYAWWKALAADRTTYEAAKKRFADVTVAEFERRWSGFRDQVEVVDVATPLTTERYTGNWKGSIEGWMIYANNTNLMGKSFDQTLPGLADFYMIGQWVEPGGGLPPSAMSGRKVIQTLCKQEDRPFVTGEE